MTKYIPYEYQEVAENFVLDNKKCGLFLDMGLRQNYYNLYSFR